MREISFSDLCGFTEKQRLALLTADAHKYTLYGGSRGPGKSYFLRWYMLRRLLLWAGQGHKNVNVMLGCEDYPSLKDRQIGKIATEFPKWLGTLSETQERGLGFHLYPQYGGGSLLLRNLDDPSKYQSAEFGGIAIDELTKNPESTFHILRGSLRWKGIEDTFFLGATNPEANWVRSYWIEHRLPEELAGHESDFAFVSALPTDNPHLPESYWQELNTLPNSLRQAWLHGDWYASVEGLVYDNFSAANIVDDEPDARRPVDLAIDDGYIDPRATLFIQRKSDGDILVFDELYETKTLEEETISNIRERAQARQVKPRLAAVSHEAVALIRRLQEAGFAAQNWLEEKVGGGRSTRLAAITLTRSLVCDGKGHRAIKVHRRCKHLLDELTMGYKYPEGKHGLESKPADGNDHAANALESWVWLRGKPQPAAVFAQGSAKGWNP